MNCDRAAFEEAFVLGTAKTVRFLLAKGCKPEEAEELAQTAWSRAWEKREQFRGDSELITWVISIALNQLRGKWRSPGPAFVEETVLNSISLRPDHDTKILVAQLLARVDGRTRQVLTDCYLTESRPLRSNSALFKAIRRARHMVTRKPTLVAKVRQAAAAA